MIWNIIEDGHPETIDPAIRAQTVGGLLHIGVGTISSTYSHQQKPVKLKEGARRMDARGNVVKSLAAVNMGIDLQGICLFPRLICPTGTLRRVAAQRHLRYGAEGDKARALWALRSQGTETLGEFGRVTRLDETPHSDPVEIARHR